MLSPIWPATRILAFIALVTGLLYPLSVTCVAKWLCPAQAEGSLIRVRGEVVGSQLLGQNFTHAEYFWGRLSGTATSAYNARASGGTNYGPMQRELRQNAEMRIAACRAAASSEAPIPIDLVTASGSGLDPNISPAAAWYQIRRVAQARGLAEDVVERLVREHTRPRLGRLLGEPTVHVLNLNIALDQIGKESR